MQIRLTIYNIQRSEKTNSNKINKDDSDALSFAQMSEPMFRLRLQYYSQQ
jgi:hypothetical protein